MLVNVKFSQNLPPNTVSAVTQYLMQEDFQTHVMQPYITDNRRRFLTPMTPFGQLITIQHTGWYARATNPSYLVTLTCVSTLGLLDVMLLSHEGTLDTSLLWLMVPKAHIFKATDIGVVVGSGVPNKNDPVMHLTNQDALLVMADQRFASTVVLNSEAYAYETY